MVLGGDSRGLVQEKVQGQKLHYGGERLRRKPRALKICVRIPGGGKVSEI